MPPPDTPSGPVRLATQPLRGAHPYPHPMMTRRPLPARICLTGMRAAYWLGWWRLYDRLWRLEGRWDHRW